MSDKPLSLITTAAAQDLGDGERQISDWSVLLWSQSQNAFHIEPVKHMLTSNRRAYADDRPMDYAPVFFGDQNECCSLADRLRGTLRCREQLKDVQSAGGGKGERDAR